MNSPTQQPKRRTSLFPQFGIAEIMMATMIICVMAAAGNYLRSAMENGQGRAVFALFTLASPMALVLILGAYQGIKRWVKKLQ